MRDLSFLSSFFFVDIKNRIKIKKRDDGCFFGSVGPVRRRREPRDKVWSYWGERGIYAGRCAKGLDTTYITHRMLINELTFLKNVYMYDMYSINFMRDMHGLVAELSQNKRKRVRSLVNEYVK